MSEQKPDPILQRLDAILEQQRKQTTYLRNLAVNIAWWFALTLLAMFLGLIVVVLS